jgi:hypothetical protein
MIGATYPILASAGSDRNLGGALSTVSPMVAESPFPFRRHQRLPLWKPVTPLPSCRFASSNPSDQPQKAIQYPETRPGSVQ